MTIGDLAKKAGLTAQTIRYYEREGLLSRAHRWRDNNYRDFDDEAVSRLQFVRAAKEAGFTLREIKQLLDLALLPDEACEAVGQLLVQKLMDVDQKIAEMQRLRKGIVELGRACRKCAPGRACVALVNLGIASAGKPSRARGSARKSTT